MRWLQKCCCCFSLRNGGLFASAWTTFTAFLMIALQVFNITSMKNLTRYQIKHGGIKVISRKILASLEIVFGISLVVVSLVLSIAVIKERRKLMLPYIVGVLLYEVYDFCSLIFYVGKGVQISSSVWIPDAVMLGINMYCVLAVLSLYKQLARIERWRAIDQMDSTEY